MAIVSRKISSFPNLPKLSGEEFIMVAYNGKSYKIPVKMLTGNAIQTISQRVNDGDGADNPITMVVGLGEDAVTYTFHLYNGQRGSEGPQGKTGEKGVKGDTGIAIYDYDDIDGLIYLITAFSKMNSMAFFVFRSFSRYFMLSSPISSFTLSAVI